MKGILVEPGLPGITVDVTEEKLRAELGFVSFGYPYDDPVCLAHDDNGIANHRLPNRWIHGNIMPGPFYVLGVNDSGDLTDLTPDLLEKYLHHFEEPDTFPPGRWMVTTSTESSAFGTVFHIESRWVASDD